MEGRQILVWTITAFKKIRDQEMGFHCEIIVFQVIFIKLFKITFRSTSSKISNINEFRAWRKTWILACPLHKQPAALTFCLPGPLLAHCCEATKLPSRLIQVTYVTSLGYLCPKPASSKILDINMLVYHLFLSEFHGPWIQALWSQPINSELLSKGRSKYCIL